MLSTAKPDMKRDNEKIGTFVVKMVIPLPTSAITLAKISTGRRPIESAIAPNICVPKTEPTKNIDWPIVDFHAESHTQFNCFKWNKRSYFIKDENSMIKEKNGKKVHLLHCSYSDSRGPAHRTNDHNFRCHFSHC